MYTMVSISRAILTALLSKYQESVFSLDKGQYQSVSAFKFLVLYLIIKYCKMVL